MGDKAAVDLVEKLNVEFRELEEDERVQGEGEQEIFELDAKGELIAVKEDEKNHTSLTLQEFLIVEELLTAKPRQDYPTQKETLVTATDGTKSNPKKIAAALDIKTIKQTLPGMKLDERRYLVVAALVEKIAREIASIPTGNALLKLDFKVIFLSFLSFLFVFTLFPSPSSVPLSLFCPLHSSTTPPHPIYRSTSRSQKILISLSRHRSCRRR